MKSIIKITLQITNIGKTVLYISIQPVSSKHQKNAPRKLLSRYRPSFEKMMNIAIHVQNPATSPFPLRPPDFIFLPSNPYKKIAPIK